MLLLLFYPYDVLRLWPLTQCDTSKKNIVVKFLIGLFRVALLVFLINVFC
jgi:hypothetical protein